MVEIGRVQHLAVDYDRLADVLYFVLGAPVPDEGEDGPRGVVFRYSAEDGLPTDVTIVGFTRNAWAKNLGELSGLVGKHLRLDPTEGEMSINGVFDGALN